MQSSHNKEPENDQEMGLLTPNAQENDNLIENEISNQKVEN